MLHAPTTNLFLSFFHKNLKVFRIFYIKSRIGDEKFPSLFFFFFYFFFFVWCLGFRIWFNYINSWWWKFASLLFFSFVWCLGKHLIWSIETRGYGFSTRGEPILLYFSFFFFFSLFDVWVSIWFDLLDSRDYGFFFFK